jgi:hypothetical protein
MKVAELLGVSVRVAIVAGLLQALCLSGCSGEHGSEDGLSETSNSSEALANTGDDREGDCIASKDPDGCIDCWAQRDEQCSECGDGDMPCCRLSPNCEVLNKRNVLPAADYGDLPLNGGYSAPGGFGSGSVLKP